jgi:hypothetical protein
MHASAGHAAHMHSVPPAPCWRWPSICTPNLPPACARFWDGCNYAQGTIVDPAADCLTLQLYEYVNSIKASGKLRPALRGWAGVRRVLPNAEGSSARRMPWLECCGWSVACPACAGAWHPTCCWTVPLHAGPDRHRHHQHRSHRALHDSRRVHFEGRRLHRAGRFPADQHGDCCGKLAVLCVGWSCCWLPRPPSALWATNLPAALAHMPAVTQAPATPAMGRPRGAAFAPAGLTCGARAAAAIDGCTSSWSSNPGNMIPVAISSLQFQLLEPATLPPSPPQPPAVSSNSCGLRWPAASCNPPNVHLAS